MRSCRENSTCLFPQAELAKDLGVSQAGGKADLTAGKDFRWSRGRRGQERRQGCRNL